MNAKIKQAREALELAQEELWRIGSSEVEHEALWSVRRALAALSDGEAVEPVARPQPHHPGRWIGPDDGISYPSEQAAQAAIDELSPPDQSEVTERSVDFVNALNNGNVQIDADMKPYYPSLSGDIKEIVDRLRRHHDRLSIDAAMMIEHLAKKANRNG